MYFPFSHPDNFRLCSGWYCKCIISGNHQTAESSLLIFFIKVLSVAFVFCGFYLRYIMVSGWSYAFAPGWIISEPKIIRMTINRSCSCHNVDHIRNYGINVCILTLLFFCVVFFDVCVLVSLPQECLILRTKKKLARIDNVVLLVLLFFFMVVADCLFYFHAFVFSRKWHSCEIIIIIHINYIMPANSIIIFSTYLLQSISFKAIRLVYHFIKDVYLLVSC